MTIISETPTLSPQVLAVKAEFLARGVVVLDEERPTKGAPAPSVAASRPERAAAAVAELLGAGWELDWVGTTPREIVPRALVDYSDRGMGVLKLGIVLYAEEHIDEVLLAEDDEKIVVAAYVCSPGVALPGARQEVAKVYAERDIGDRLVIDALTGEVLRRAN